MKLSKGVRRRSRWKRRRHGPVPSFHLNSASSDGQQADESSYVTERVCEAVCSWLGRSEHWPLGHTPFPNAYSFCYPQRTACAEVRCCLKQSQASVSVTEIVWKAREVRKKNKFVFIYVRINLEWQWLPKQADEDGNEKYVRVRRVPANSMVRLESTPASLAP